MQMAHQKCALAYVSGHISDITVYTDTSFKFVKGVSKYKCLVAIVTV